MKLFSTLIILLAIISGSALAAKKDSSALMTDELFSEMKLRNIGPAYIYCFTKFNGGRKESGTCKTSKF